MISTSFLQTAFEEKVLWESSSTGKQIFSLTGKHQITYIHYSPGLVLEVSKYIWNGFQEMYEHMQALHVQGFLKLVYPLKKITYI